MPKVMISAIGDEPTGPSFHRDGSTLWRPELPAARRHSVARRKRLAVGYARQPLSRLPLRIFGGEFGKRRRPSNVGRKNQEAVVEAPPGRTRAFDEPSMRRAKLSAARQLTLRY
jgi:hypothetical protein